MFFNLQNNPSLNDKKNFRDLFQFFLINVLNASYVNGNDQENKKVMNFHLDLKNKLVKDFFIEITEILTDGSIKTNKELFDKIYNFLSVECQKANMFLTAINNKTLTNFTEEEDYYYKYILYFATQYNTYSELFKEKCEIEEDIKLETYEKNQTKDGTKDLNERYLKVFDVDLYGNSSKVFPIHFKRILKADTKKNAEKNFEKYFIPHLVIEKLSEKELNHFFALKIRQIIFDNKKENKSNLLYFIDENNKKELTGIELKFYKDFFNYGPINLEDDAKILKNEFSENFIKDLIFNYFILGNYDVRFDNMVAHIDENGDIDKIKTIDFERSFAQIPRAEKNLSEQNIDFLFNEKSRSSLTLKERFYALVMTISPYIDNSGYKIDYENDEVFYKEQNSSSISTNKMLIKDFLAKIRNKDETEFKKQKILLNFLESYIKDDNHLKLMINELFKAIYSKKSEIETCKKNLSSLMKECKKEIATKEKIEEEFKKYYGRGMTEDEANKLLKINSVDSILEMDKDYILTSLNYLNSENLSHEKRRKEEEIRLETIKKNQKIYLKMADFLSSAIDKNCTNEEKKALNSILEEIQKNSSSLSGDFAKDQQDKNISELIDFFINSKVFKKSGVKNIKSYNRSQIYFLSAIYLHSRNDIYLSELYNQKNDSEYRSILIERFKNNYINSKKAIKSRCEKKKEDADMNQFCIMMIHITLNALCFTMFISAFLQDFLDHQKLFHRISFDLKSYKSVIVNGLVFTSDNGPKLLPLKEFFFQEYYNKKFLLIFIAEIIVLLALIILVHFIYCKFCDRSANQEIKQLEELETTFLNLANVSAITTKQENMV